MIKSAVLYVRLHKKYAAQTAEEIKTELDNRGIQTSVFSFDDKPKEAPALSGKWDIAFSLGGDGTVLYAARNLAPLGVPILSVNLGTLGFIAGIDREHWLDVFQKWENGEISVSKRCMFNISVERENKIIMESICLNDAVISATGIAKLIKLDVFMDLNSSLGIFRCDGLIISTPTGSTAYSMAAGGPILDPEMEAVIINPICPFTLSTRPFVLPSRDDLYITVAKEQRSGVLLTVDGQDTFNLECSDKVIIRQSSYHALLISPGKHTYYAALRNKLFWSPSVTPGDAS